MSNESTDYEWKPVTAADRWWECKPHEVRCYGNDVLAIVAYPYRAGRWFVVTAYSADNASIVNADVNGFGITRRVPRAKAEGEGWRYFGFKNGTQVRTNSHRTEVMTVNGWVVTNYYPASKYIEAGCIETDQHGTPLATEHQKPNNKVNVAEYLKSLQTKSPPTQTRTPLTAEQVPAWATWVRHKDWRGGVRSTFAVDRFSVMIGFTDADIPFDFFAERYQLGDTNGNWYDATVEGVAQRRAK